MTKYEYDALRKLCMPKGAGGQAVQVKADFSHYMRNPDESARHITLDVVETCDLLQAIDAIAKKYGILDFNRKPEPAQVPADAQEPGRQA